MVASTQARQHHLDIRFAPTTLAKYRNLADNWRQSALVGELSGAARSIVLRSSGETPAPGGTTAPQSGDIEIRHS